MNAEVSALDIAAKQLRQCDILSTAKQEEQINNVQSADPIQSPHGVPSREIESEFRN